MPELTRLANGKRLNGYPGDLRYTGTSPTPCLSIKPEIPTRPCNICGDKSYWLRLTVGMPEYICATCHPSSEPDKAHYMRVK